MILAKRAALLGELGKLWKSLALAEEQFKTVKALILKDDPRVTVDLLSTLGVFWEQRAEGILTDIEYNDQVVEALECMHSGDALAVADASEFVLHGHHSSAKRKKRRVGGVEVIEGGSSDFSAVAGGTTESSTTLSFDREVISVCESEDGGSGNAGTGLGDGDDDSRTESEGGSVRGGRQSGGGKDCDGDVTDDEDDIWSLIRSQRWMPTDDFKVPGKSFCNDETLLRVVDSTVDLLKMSKAKAFPKLRRGHNQGIDNTQRFHRQKKMFNLLKKVTICRGKDGEEQVFRATPIEIKDGLEEIWGKSLDDDFCADEFFEEIIAKRS